MVFCVVEKKWWGNANYLSTVSSSEIENPTTNFSYALSGCTIQWFLTLYSYNFGLLAFKSFINLGFTTIYTHNIVIILLCTISSPGLFYDIHVLMYSIIYGRLTVVYQSKTRSARDKVLVGFNFACNFWNASQSFSNF